MIPSISCITWNIHRARGRDGVVDPDRITQVLTSEICHTGPDILVLTEADTETPPHERILDLDRISATTGLCHAQQERQLRWGDDSHGFLGTVILLAPRFQVLDATVLDLPGHCHRGAAVLDLRVDGQDFRLIGTHLSLGQPLRIAQMRVIGQYLFRARPLPTVLAGDLNEWRPWGGLAFSRRIFGQPLTGPVRRTFPAAKPLLPLDRILAGPGMRVENGRVMSSPAVLDASDHLPLAADLSFGGT